MEFAYLPFASLSLALFFVFLLLAKKGKSCGDYFLITFFVLLSTNYAAMFIISRNLDGYQWLLELSESSVFLYGPLLWWYVRSYTEIDFRMDAVHWGHAFPFLMALALLESHAIADEGVSDLTRFTLLALKLGSMFLYLLMILNIMGRYRRRLKQFYSTTERLQLNWMYLLIWSILSVWVIAVIGLVLYFFLGVDVPLRGGLYSNIAISIFIFVLGIYGFRQKIVFTPAQPFREVILAVENEVATQIEPIKYRNSGLQADAAEQQFDRLMTHMEVDKPYLDQEITLFKLAEQLQISPNHLSQIINSRTKMNFFDFINSYRVDAVKELMVSPKADHWTLLALGMDAGFNSKASFNRAFKKFVGMTPSEYRKSKAKGGSRPLTKSATTE